MRRQKQTSYAETHLETLTHWGKRATLSRCRRMFGPGSLFILRVDTKRDEYCGSQHEAHVLYSILAREQVVARG